MKKITFIINPITVRHSRFNESEVLSFFPPEEYDVEFAYSNYKGHILELAKEALIKQVDIIVAVGGDGTIHEIAQVITNTTTILGIFPTGFQSAFSSYLELPTRSKKILELIKKETVTKIDTIVVEKNLSERIIGVCYAGIGLTSNIVYDIEQENKTRNYFYYWNKTLKNYKKIYDPILHFRFHYFDFSTRVFELLVSNIDQYRSKMRYFENAKTDDGLLDILVIRKANLFRFILFAIQSFLGISDTFYDQMEFYKTEDIHFKFHTPTRLQIDFESYTLKGNISMRANKQSLNIIVP